MKPLYVYVTDEQHEWVYQQAKEEHTSMSEVVRQLIDGMEKECG